MDKGAALFWTGSAGLMIIGGAAILDQPLPQAAARPVTMRATAAPAPLVRPASLPPTADAGAVLAAERAWEARVEAYRQQLALAVAANPPPGDLAHIHQRLLDAHFHLDEQRLLKAYIDAGVPQLTRQ